MNICKDKEMLLNLTLIKKNILAHGSGLPYLAQFWKTAAEVWKHCISVSRNNDYKCFHIATTYIQVLVHIFI